MNKYLYSGAASNSIINTPWDCSLSVKMFSVSNFHTFLFPNRDFLFPFRDFEVIYIQVCYFCKYERLKTLFLIPQMVGICSSIDQHNLFRTDLVNLCGWCSMLTLTFLSHFRFNSSLMWSVSLKISIKLDMEALIKKNLK